MEKYLSQEFNDEEVAQECKSLTGVNNKLSKSKAISYKDPKYSTKKKKRGSGISSRMKDGKYTDSSQKSRNKGHLKI